MPILFPLILQKSRRNYVLLRLRLSDDGDVSIKKQKKDLFPFLLSLLNLYEYLFSVQRKRDPYPDEDKNKRVD
jgi:hypothetical protein